MNEDKIQELIKTLTKKRVRCKSYDGSMFDTDLIQREGHIVLEEIIRGFLLDNRDEKQGVLEAKVFMYEQIISKSNFAPMIDFKNNKPFE